ncbi:MAG: ankyrin repeat domain-containing protein [Candidatus Dependentiae bacterium]|nr:ankyrin repeat domain-containing protein [Candidatus Dependentiae bacterium]
MINSKFKSRFFLTLSMVACFVGALHSKPVAWNVVPTTESVLIQDSRWHTLSGKEKSVMLQIMSHQFLVAIEALKNDTAMYQSLSSKYDFLAMSHDDVFQFFLLSQGVRITDQGIQRARYCMQQLLDFGLSPNHKLSNGDTVLHDAIKAQNWSVVEVLLRAQADVTLTDAAGKTPFDYVRLSDMKHMWFHGGSGALLYKHLTLCQKARANLPESGTVVLMAILAATAYGYYKVVIAK